MSVIDEMVEMSRSRLGQMVGTYGIEIDEPERYQANPKKLVWEAVLEILNRSGSHTLLKNELVRKVKRRYPKLYSDDEINQSIEAAVEVGLIKRKNDLLSLDKNLRIPKELFC